MITTLVATKTLALLAMLLLTASACQNEDCDACAPKCDTNCDHVVFVECCRTCRTSRCCRPTPTPPPSPQRWPAPPPAQQTPVLVNSTNINNNNLTFPINITIEHVINNYNNITIPINVTVQNINDIRIQSESSIVPQAPGPFPYVVTSSPTPQTTTTSRPSPCANSNVTIKVRVPFPYPVPYYPQPPTGCCHVVRPCVPHGCQWHSSECGGCCNNGPIVFQPHNPCQRGCVRLDTSYQTWCFGRNHCRYVPVDCSGCPDDFHNDYATFARCGGCFRPRFNVWNLFGAPWITDGAQNCSQSRFPLYR